MRSLVASALSLSLAAAYAAPMQAMSGVPARGAARQVTRSEDPRLPNYDIRLDQAAAAKAALANFRQQAGVGKSQLAAVQQDLHAAEALLRAQVPTLRVEYNEDLRIPEVIGTDPSTRSFLTGAGRPAGQPQAESVRAFLGQNQALFGLSAEQIAGLKVVADYVNPAGNLAYVDLAQEFNGRPVFRGEVRAMITRDGRLARLINNLAPHLEAGALPIDAGGAQDAVRAAAGHIDHQATDADLEVVSEKNDGLTVEFASGQFADPTTAEQLYFPTEAGVARLAWRVLLWEPVAAYYVIVDAETGTLLWRKNITNDQTQSATYGVYTNDSPGPLSPTNATPGSAIQGAGISRTTVNLIGNEAPNTFNNLGWITDGNNLTDGNNVEAGLDRTGGDGVDPGGIPTGTPARTFDFGYNPPPGGADNPLASGYPVNPMDDYQKGVVTNLFYWTNIYHDRTYRLGFTEAARNFQDNNLGRGGVAGDRVRGEAQDSSGTNNANFSTGVDGVRGRMQMYIFDSPTPDRDGDLDAEVFIHELTHGLSNRLIGNASGLGNNRGSSMGEGWGDFYGRSILSTAAEDTAGVYAMGGYVTLNFLSLGTDNYYYGIRRFPYALITTTGGPLNRPHNPLTFADIDPAQINTSNGAYPITPWITNTATEVHNAGEVWCMALLEVRARIIARLGYAVGNDRMLQIVTDGMKGTPTSPNFIQARDAIMAADQAGFAGADMGDIWAGFAVRGMGYGAQDGLAASAVVESFALPNLQQTPTITVTDGNGNGSPEPGERLVLNVPITNPLSAPATSVMVSVNGGPAVSYGTINGTETITQPIDLRVPVGQACGSVLPLAFSITSSLGPTTANSSLRIGIANVAAFGPFGNSTAITIPASGTGAVSGAPATPYPSNITASGTTGPFDTITVGLTGLTHTFPSDVDVLLVGPAGQKFVLMSDAGGPGDVSGISLTFEDSAAAILNTTQLAGGTFRPTNYITGDAFPAPAPAGPYANPATAGTDTLVSTFGAADANGTWSLYVVDDASVDIGSISGGWNIAFSRTSYTCPAVKGDLDQDVVTDLLFRLNTTGQNDVWFMNGVARASLVTLPDVPASLNQSIVGVDDFNADRQSDLVLWDSTTGAVEFWLMNGTSRVGAPVPIGGAVILPPNWKLSATGDFNADGQPDIVWRNFTSQKIVLWTMNGTNKIGNLTPTPDQAVDGNWEIVAALDYNGDGNRDFLWYNSTSGNIVQWLMNAAVQRTTGRFTIPMSAGDSNWKVLASGDYGVGPSGVPSTNDVVWRNATSGAVVVWYLDLAGNRTSGTFTTPTSPTPNPTDWTIVGPR